ncbi:MAG: type IV pilus twitching motility protein PilT [Candidatus Eremiobacteraeota bacterium]|nr:type IV pilus twitching motility protein PilT [Candidatus Eremiobacteraeota bacterium]MCW5868232.1 type IV pilus twitching motility protein PilT [Candidatus Eremiobacteraeota bacterium]
MRYTMDELLRITVERGASDLHLTVGLPPVLRINGSLVATEYSRLSPEEAKRLVYSILNDKQKEKFEKTWELDCSHGVRGFGRFRVNVYRQRGVVGACLRAITNTVATRTELNLPRIVEDMVNRPHGLILVTGATGAGKSTTLACMLDIINQTQSYHIITIEDPIEYIHPHKKSMINQREVGHDTLTWSNALKATLREDPDVILVGEMRDQETIAGTLTAAETGHLVFSTLHTCDASQTIERVVDVFPPHHQQQIRVQLSSVLEGVVSQQLVPHAAGVGRVPSVEVLIATPAIRNLIREGKTHQIYNAIQTGSKLGMQTMEQSLFELVQSKMVTADEALAHTMHPDDFKRMVENTRR